MNKKLRELGEEVDVSKKDIQKIRKERHKDKVFLIIVGILSTILVLIIGYGVKEFLTAPTNGYPYAIGIPLMTKQDDRKTVITLLITLILVAGTMIVACFGYMTLYNVFNKESKKSIIVRYQSHPNRMSGARK